MTPRQYQEYAEAEKKMAQEEAIRLSEEWHIPLDSPRKHEYTLFSAKETMEKFALTQDDIPFIIKLTENPNYRTARFLGGAVDLFTHDCIHILLGRGVLLKDEAFVIGYTMGSSKKINRWRRNLFMFICKYLYPKGYKFGEEERFVFNMGVVAGNQCKTDLSECDFKEHGDKSIEYTRHKLGIDVSLLKGCYAVESKCFKDRESQRLL